MPRSQTSNANCPFINARLNHNYLPNFVARHTQRRASPGYARNNNKLDEHRKTTPTYTPTMDHATNQSNCFVVDTTYISSIDTNPLHKVSHKIIKLNLIGFL
jgi:hypothetical protein